MIYNDFILDNILDNYFDTNIIRQHDNVIIALSGGIDSMCLFDVMFKLKSEINFNLYAIHVNHGIRGLEAEGDENFVRKYCKDFNIKLFVSKVDAVSFSKDNNLTLEEAGRILRYREFDNLYQKLKKKNINTFILTAHHKKDQVETILHNIIRGSGLKGLCGMSNIKNYIVRPMLNISKNDIEKYVESHNIPYRNDSTNNDINYTRNYLRKEIINKLYTINNKFDDHIIMLSNQVKDVIDYINNVSNYIYNYICIEKDKTKIIIDLKKFNDVHIAIKSNIIKIIFNELVDTLKDFANVHILDIINLCNKEKGGHLDLPYNITVDKIKNTIIFKKNKINISMSRRKK